MPNPSPNSLTFYPSYCYPLSPTYNNWVRLTAADVHALRERAGYEGQNLYFHLNHPIKWVRLVGVVVALDVYPARWIIVLDDSSGATIEVTCGRQPPAPQIGGTKSDPLFSVDIKAAVGSAASSPVGLTATGRTIDLSGVDVGAVVKVKGGVGVFRGEKQVSLERISLIPTTNDEITTWAETNSFRESILMIPWIISPQDEERARKKSEGIEEENEKKKIRAEKRKKKQEEKKREAERKARKNPQRIPHRTKRNERDERGAPSESRNGNKTIPRNHRQSSAHEVITTKPKIGDQERKEKGKEKEIDKMAPDPRGHAQPCRFDALGF